MTTRHTGKNIKIFLSSTFRDMDAERDAIMNRVYPAVAQQLAPYNIHVDFIDLRWGVSTSDVDEAERENHVLRECIDGIQSSRPFFIGTKRDGAGDSLRVAHGHRQSAPQLLLLPLARGL